MSFQVGVLYSAQEFLALLDEFAIEYVDPAKVTYKIGLVEGNRVITLCVACEWIEVNLEAKLKLTARGRAVLAAATPSLKLQAQLQDLLRHERPPWSKKLRHGRDEAVSAMPADAKQCFEEAGLLNEWSSDLVVTWSALTKRAWLESAFANDDVGLQAEWWSMQYETHRTGQEPMWISRDSSYAGFDIASVTGSKNSQRLRIEVKGTLRGTSDAEFNVTRHEWNTAKKQLDWYYFDLWRVAREPTLYRVNARIVEPHVPGDRGEGRWHQVVIPYKLFRDGRMNLSEISGGLLDYRFIGDRLA